MSEETIYPCMPELAELFPADFMLLYLGCTLSNVVINTENKIMVYSVIAALLILTAITVIRSLESRNQWRRMIEDGEVEVKDKISFD